MALTPTPTVRSEYCCGGRQDIETTLGRLAVNCAAYKIPNDTGEDALTATAFPDGVPEHCEIAAAILANGTAYFSFDRGTTWLLFSVPSTSTIADYRTGAIVPFAGALDKVPANWMLCDGRELSRTVFADLFAVIGTTYGTGDGSTTFNLPDMQGRSAVGGNYATLPDGANGSRATRDLNDSGGADDVTLTIDTMPAHTHSSNKGTDANAIDNDGGTARRYSPKEAEAGSYSSTSTGGDQAHNNLQPYRTAHYIIRT